MANKKNVDVSILRHIELLENRNMSLIKRIELGESLGHDKIPYQVANSYYVYKEELKKNEHTLKYLKDRYT